MSYTTVCVSYTVAVSAMVSILLAIIGAPMWSFFALSYVALTAIILLLYWSLEYIDKCSYSIMSEKEKSLAQKYHK